jgi:hypothetical protein
MREFGITNIQGTILVDDSNETLDGDLAINMYSFNLTYHSSRMRLRTLRRTRNPGGFANIKIFFSCDKAASPRQTVSVLSLTHRKFAPLTAQHASVSSNSSNGVRTIPSEVGVTAPTLAATIALSLPIPVADEEYLESSSLFAKSAEALSPNPPKRVRDGAN